MKRILALLCVIACLCGLCVPVMAADTCKVTAIVPADWDAPNCYYWVDGVGNPNWPGDPMEVTAEGWVYNIPADCDRVIINNGSGSPQTVDITITPGVDVVVTVGEAGADGKFSATTDGATPPAQTPDAPSAGIDLSGLNSLSLVGGGIPGLAEWNPGDPAGEMTKVSNGVYTKVIAVTAGASMEIKAAGNGEWNDAYNFGPAENGTAIVVGTKMEMVNGGGAQNFALTAEKDCNLKFTVDLTGDVPTLLVEETTEEADTLPENPGTSTTPDSGETITVYAKVPDTWTDVRVWAWDDNQNNASSEGWPGNIYMTLGDNGWYSVELPLGFNNILINANGGGSQTGDLAIEAGKDVWVDALTDYTNAVVYYEEVEIKEPVPTDPPATQPPATQPSTSTTEPGGEDEKAPTDNTVLFSVIGSVIVIAIAAVVYIVLKKKQG